MLKIPYYGTDFLNSSGLRFGANIAFCLSADSLLLHGPYGNLILVHLDGMFRREPRANSAFASDPRQSGRKS